VLEEEKVTAHKRTYLNYVRRNTRFMDRMVESFKFFSGLDNGQWPEHLIDMLKQEGRVISSFNFIQNKILTLAGSFIDNTFDTKFMVRGNTSEDTVLFLQDLYQHDRDMSRMPVQRLQFLIAMLVQQGVMEIYKDYTESPLGNIRFRYRNGFQVQTDPDWMTMNVRDNKRIFIHTKMDAEDIVQTWGNKSGDIEEAFDRLKNLIADPSDQTSEIDKIADRSPEFYDSLGDKYKVVEMLQMKWVKKARLYNIRSQEWLPPMDERVARARLRFPGSEDLRLLPDHYQECQRTIFCPALNKGLILDEGPESIQIETYPLFIASALTIHGERQGAVDPLKDPQATYNKRESTMTHWQGISALGIEFVEEDAMSETEYKRYLREGNVPGNKFKVAPGTNKDVKIKIKERGQAPSDLFSSADRALSMGDRIWAPPSTQGFAERSGESAKLFADKRQQALLALKAAEEVLMDVEYQMGSAYFLAAKQCYAGIPRELTLANGKVLRLNWLGEDGVKYNEIGKLPRASVIITQAPSSRSLREDRLNIFYQLRSMVTTPAAQAVIDKKIVEYLPGISEADKDEALAIVNKNMQLIEARMDAELTQYAQTRAQGGPPAPGGAPQGPFTPGQGPQQGGGFSAEGKAIEPGAGLPVDVSAQNQING
jgi:hypothetical protein